MLPLTHDECRARFHRAAADAGLDVDRHPISARGPLGQELTIDVVSAGAPAPRHALVVLSGVHGVEGFISSAMQCELLSRLPPDGLPADVGVVVVHAVNPWGMAHGRRQNESNVDLNRNWGRDGGPPTHNDDYDEIHAIACPDTPSIPSVDDLLAQVGPVLDTTASSGRATPSPEGSTAIPMGCTSGASTPRSRTEFWSRPSRPGRTGDRGRG